MVPVAGRKGVPRLPKDCRQRDGAVQAETLLMRPLDGPIGINIYDSIPDLLVGEASSNFVVVFTGKPDVRGDVDEAYSKEIAAIPVGDG